MVVCQSWQTIWNMLSAEPEQVSQPLEKSVCEYECVYVNAHSQTHTHVCVVLLFHKQTILTSSHFVRVREEHFIRAKINRIRSASPNIAWLKEVPIS